MERIPNELRSNSLKSLARAVTSIYPGNPASTIDEEIFLYDLAFKKDTDALSRILSHELAHIYWQSLPAKTRQNYMIAGRWLGQQDSPRSWAGRPNGYVEYFLFEPVKLKKVTPSVFTWLGQRFGSKFKPGGPCEPKR